MHVDLGICRFDDLFLTNEYGEQIPVELLRAAYPDNVPSIDIIKQENQEVNKPEKQAVLIPESTKNDDEPDIKITI